MEAMKHMAIPTEKQLDSTTISYGACKFCHQNFALEVLKEGMSEEKLEELATRKCDCNEARNYLSREKKRDKVIGNIVELFGEASTTSTILIEQIDRIASGNVLKVTVDSGNGYKGTLQMTSKGTLKVERSISRKLSKEETYE